MTDISRGVIEELIVGAEITSALYSFLDSGFLQRLGEGTVGRKYSIELPNVPPPPGVQLFGSKTWKPAAAEIYVPADCPGEDLPDPMVFYDRKEGIQWSERMLTVAATALYRAEHLDGRPVQVYLIDLPDRKYARLWMAITAEEYQR